MIRMLLGILLLGLCVSCDLFKPAPLTLPDRTDLIIRGVNYVGLSVSDLDSVSDFYTGSANLELVQESVISNSELIDGLAGRKDVEVNTRLLKSINAQIRLMKFQSPSEQAMSTPAEEIHGPGFSHVCYQVAKSTNAYGRFLEAGGKPLGIREMVQLNPRRPVDYAYLRDIDGTIFEVEHVDIAALDLDKPPKSEYRLRHVAIATPDIDRAAAFYSILFEEPKPRRVGGSKGFSGEKVDQISGLKNARIKMAWFQIRNLEFEIGQYVSHPTQTPTQARPLDALGYNMIVFDVVDLDAAREKLIEGGGTVVSDVHTLDGGRIFFGRDPDSNLLGFQVITADSPVSAQNFEDNGV